MNRVDSLPSRSFGQRTAAHGISQRPLLRWAGSKRRVIPKLQEYWDPGYQRYIEPFCGSAALFFSLAPTHAVLSDTNEDLMCFYSVLRDDPTRLWRAIKAIPRTKSEYVRTRQRVPHERHRLARAVRFYYLNRNCFNGLYRTNRDGRFNVPFSRERTGTMPTEQQFRISAEALIGASLRTCDFGHTLRTATRGDFVYMDPPFYVQSRRLFRQYGPKHFEAEDIARLRRHLDRLQERGAAFLLSLADCAEARLIAKDWDSRRTRVRRHIAGFSSSRRKAVEWLISNC